ncbi:hypothetical protein SDC9_07510 [bioreactor metagenome]|uniref:DUF357 domain-containing protein n=1 Tax=bioreactor metagenome TaxID=1076179 RepID=A0A644T7M2_9ZZZZ|nr:DUF357 domain-containing protein [Methanobrevibacter sp.]MEA4956965.1 DUF357 domain-containing protein [Methanobrevibacter sp.]
MNNTDRILSDIEKLDESLDKIESLKLNKEEKEIIKRAKNYKKDSNYYLQKEDELTSFGCITYAHGLIDALLINRNIE